jgi:phenylacetic acid degradation operon negative regulatory protein
MTELSMPELGRAAPGGVVVGPAAHAILDDFDSRPGSATSLIRTVLGAYRRELGGSVAIAELIGLMGELGVAADATRIAVTQLKRRDVLEPAARGGRTGYRLTAQAEAMYARGDRRIFGYRRMSDADPWRLISFTIPETLRAARHQLRRRLGWIGCGTVSPGLWIAPGYLADEISDIVAALGLSEYVTTFLCTSLAAPDTPAAAAARWWDLDGIAARHREFLASHHATPSSARELTPARHSWSLYRCWTNGASSPMSTRACLRPCCPPTGPVAAVRAGSPRRAIAASR